MKLSSQDSCNFENKRPLGSENYGLFNIGANIGTQILIVFKSSSNEVRVSYVK